MIWSTTPRSKDELVIYLRLLSSAASTQDVGDAARRTYFHMPTV